MMVVFDTLEKFKKTYQTCLITKQWVRIDYTRLQLYSLFHVTVWNEYNENTAHLLA